MIKVLEFGIVRLAKTSFSREQRSLMSTSTSYRTFAHKSGNYRVNSVACATQLVTHGPTNLAKETTNEVEEENEVERRGRHGSMRNQDRGKQYTRNHTTFRYITADFTYTAAVPVIYKSRAPRRRGAVFGLWVVEMGAPGCV